MRVSRLLAGAAAAGVVLLLLLVITQGRTPRSIAPAPALQVIVNLALRPAAPPMTPADRTSSRSSSRASSTEARSRRSTAASPSTESAPIAVRSIQTPIAEANPPTPPASASPPLRVDTAALRQAMGAARHPVWRAADAAGQQLDAQTPSAQEKLARSMAAASKPDCFGKEQGDKGLFAVVVIPAQILANKCKMP